MTDNNPKLMLPSEWSRSVGWGTIPDENNLELHRENSVEHNHSDKRTDDIVTPSSANE